MTFHRPKHLPFPESIVITPVKAIKGQSGVIRQRNKAANDIYSRAVSSVGQPIESLFNWIIEKTNIISSPTKKKNL